MTLIPLALTAAAAWSATAAEPPYPPSAVIKGVRFDFSTHDRRAPGSDNWPITWADDDHQYTTWGDGGGFGGTNSDGRVSNGFARVEGTADAHTTVNIAGGKGAPNPMPFAGKCYGIIAVDGVLYAWRTGGGSGETAYDFQELWKSADHAATWTPTEVRWQREDFTPPDRGFFVPTFLQFGRDYAGARDGYVYTYAPHIKTDQWAVHRPGEIALIRVPKARIEEPSAYEFFAGLDGHGKPAWTSDAAARRPVWQDRANGVMRISAAFNAGLKRYLLIAEHTKRASGNIGIYEAPEPWGPWRTVHFESGWGAGKIETTTFFWNFAPRWWSNNGLGFTIVFTGTKSNDSWNTIKGSFVLP